MILKSLNLTNFRNYSKASFTFNPTTTLVLGPNTAGKTNLLEAIYFLATGKSFRVGFDREVIRGGEKFAQVRGIKGLKDVKEGDGEGLEMTILASGNGENTSSKRFKVNGIKRRLSDFAGNLRAVYFGPEEILLVTGSPSRRRRYLDSVLVQVDGEYARALSEYGKVLRQRNRLLLLIREGDLPAGRQGNRSQLDFWDEKLLALGSVLSKKRQELFDYFNEKLGGGLELVFLKSRRPLPFKKELLEREIAAGMTLWGPHRDDFRFMRDGSEQLRKLSESDGQNNQKVRNSDMSEVTAIRGTEARSYSEFSDLSSFGSRGEQRLAVLHLKLAELGFITERTGERPLLLLDDIFSELDEDNRGRVLKLLGQQQTIVTATDLDQIDSEKLGGFEVLPLR